MKPTMLKLYNLTNQHHEVFRYIDYDLPYKIKLKILNNAMLKKHGYIINQNPEIKEVKK